jgi:hypothetical protein
LEAQRKKFEGRGPSIFLKKTTRHPTVANALSSREAAWAVALDLCGEALITSHSQLPFTTDSLVRLLLLAA